MATAAPLLGVILIAVGMLLGARIDQGVRPSRVVYLYPKLAGYRCQEPKPLWMPTDGSEIMHIDCDRIVHGPATSVPQKIEFGD